MKRTYLVLTLALGVSGIAEADTYVQPHFRSNGSYVPGHYRSAPNNSAFDNYSTRGNVNPYNGNPGYVSPYSYGTHRSNRGSLFNNGQLFDGNDD